MLNTRESREWVEALGKGAVDVLDTPLVRKNEDGADQANGKAHFQPPPRIRVIAERPNVYALYEQNIGLLTPILAERLQDAEGRYPMEWIEDAFSEAVTNNKRNVALHRANTGNDGQSEGKESGKDRELLGEVSIPINTRRANTPSSSDQTT